MHAVGHTAYVLASGDIAGGALALILVSRWNHRRVDSRTSRFTNKELIAEWERDYGEDSAWFRVRVLGLPPTADELQFIDFARIQNRTEASGTQLRERCGLIVVTQLYRSCGLFARPCARNGGY